MADEEIIFHSDAFAFDMTGLLSKAREYADSSDCADMLSAEAWRDSDYAIYGVDNDFDLIEALYREYCQYDAHKLDSHDFREMRLECAMNPAYTEKCFNSFAFADIRDEILAKLGL